MIDAGSRPLSFYLRYRFSPTVMKIEHAVISIMAFLFFKGNQVTWTKRRCVAYKMWENGADPQEISEKLRIPLLIARNWAEIWDSYYVAFKMEE